jgi:thiamine-phosphate pyrophosphorylase
MIARFYPIIDTAAVSARGGNPRNVAETLLAAGVRTLQYRHKDSWTQYEFDDAAYIAELCQSAGALFVVNDRADYAHLLGAGLHLGQDDLSPSAARRVVASAVIGFSTHSRQQMMIAEEEPVQYLALGPIFATASKLKPDPVVGLDRLKACRALTKKQLVAIGGITIDNALSVFDAGADSVAIISGFLPGNCDAAQITQRAKRWLAL